MDGSDEPGEIPGAVISPVHAFQNFFIPALEWDMEMGAKRSAGRDHLYQIGGHFTRFQGTEPDPNRETFATDGFQETGEIHFPSEIHTVFAEMDARQNDFPVPPLTKTFQHGQDLPGVETPVRSSCKRHDAVAAKGFAPILDFKIGPGPAGEFPYGKRLKVRPGLETSYPDPFEGSIPCLSDHFGETRLEGIPHNRSHTPDSA